MAPAQALNQLLQAAAAAPVILVALAGLAYSLVTWQRHPRVSALAAAGCVLTLFVRAAWFVIVPMVTSISNRGSTPQSIEKLLAYCNILAALVGALGIGLILVAVFLGRGPRDE